ncbi:MAG: hypothetical protein JWN91_2544 [Nocardioides sp.]|nr:hypothetical protein [Nocardioides sp.]
MKRILALGALLLLIAVCVGSWWVQTAQALELIEVHTARPVCAGATLEDDHTIRAQRGMACTVTITVSNGGSQTVHVGHVLLPFFGSQGGWVVRAGPSTSQRLDDLGVDATLPIDQDLGSGDLLQFNIELAYREGGCSGDKNGGVGGAKPWPSVTVGFLGRTIERSGAGELRFTQVGPARGCQRL